MIENVMISFGQVEDVDDPKKNGRIRVRLFDIHSESKTMIPTESLKWSNVCSGPGNSSTKGVGITPTGYQIGDLVYGFFLDEDSKQEFLVLGSVHTYTDNENDINEIAIGSGESNETVSAKKALYQGTFVETSYNAFQYPLVQVLQSRSGHIIIVNDTPGKETVEIIHKSGSGYELLPNGAIQIISQVQNNEINTGGRNRITIEDENINIGGDWNVNVGGNSTITTGDNVTIDAGSNVIVNAGSNTNINTGSSANISAGSSVSITAPSVTITPTGGGGGSVMGMTGSGGMDIKSDTKIDMITKDGNLNINSNNGNININSGTGSTNISGTVLINGIPY